MMSVSDFEHFMCHLEKKGVKYSVNSLKVSRWENSCEWVLLILILPQINIMSYWCFLFLDNLVYITNEMIQDLCKLCCSQGSISSCPITELWCGILLFISLRRPSPFGLFMCAHEAWTEKPFARLLAAVVSHQKFQRLPHKKPKHEYA